MFEAPIKQLKNVSTADWVSFAKKNIHAIE